MRIKFRLFWFIFQIDEAPNTIWHCYGDSGDSRRVFGYVCILALFRGLRAYILVYSAVRIPLANQASAFWYFVVVIMNSKNK